MSPRRAGGAQEMRPTHSVRQSAGRAGTAMWVGLLGLLALLTACSSPPKDDPSSQASLDKLYVEAKEELSSGAYERAIKLLERIEGRAAGTLLAQQAMLEMAWAQHRSGEKAQALATLDRFIKLHPSSAGIDYALYLKGLVNFNEDLGLFGRFAGQDVSERDQQASRDALQTFKELTEKYPTSRYAEDARKRIDFITNMLAQYEVHVARYYFVRGAYVAAASRAQTAFTEYQYAPAAEEALFILAQSYDQMQLKQMRDDTLRVLKKNFPNSKFASEAAGTNGKAWWKFW